MSYQGITTKCHPEIVIFSQSQNHAVGERLHALPFSSKIVIASHAEGVAWQSGNRTSLHSAERMTPASQIAAVGRYVSSLAMTPPEAG